jgi:hypothetical protein
VNTSNKSGTSEQIISLPQPGGALSGIGEKFAANHVTGISSMSVPLVTNSDRSGFGPRLPLSYDSGAGNGLGGFGCGLSWPSIRRKTDKGLPHDVFILSGAENLVPVLVKTAHGWEPGTAPPRGVVSVRFPRVYPAHYEKGEIGKVRDMERRVRLEKF